MMTFLDFDGVIIDSIEECYQVSFETYFGYAKASLSTVEYKRQFFNHRGLVGPACEYLSLHRAIEKYCSVATKAEAGSIEKMFCQSVKQVSANEADEFEKKFFFARSLYQDRDFSRWIELNPLTEFGKTLVSQTNDNIYIVTTKNKQATEAILGYYRIPVTAIYASEDIKKAGSKGALISKVLDEKTKDEAVFVDDSVAHLHSVNDNRVRCYFAGWGYGENTNYENYKF
jgi:phosphoglycolate phosphatase-like HAD superfamily hydrolase